MAAMPHASQSVERETVSSSRNEESNKLFTSSWVYTWNKKAVHCRKTEKACLRVLLRDRRAIANAALSEVGEVVMERDEVGKASAR
jgi:hypothetical protein